MKKRQFIKGPSVQNNQVPAQPQLLSGQWLPDEQTHPLQSRDNIDVFASEINTLPVPAVQKEPVSRAGIPMPGTAAWQTGGLAQTGGAMQPLPPWAKTALKRSKKKRFPIWARIVVAVFAVLVVAGGSAFAYYQVNYASSISEITGNKAQRFTSNNKKDDSAKQASVSANNAVLSGGRINILLLGSDTDGKTETGVANQGNDIASGGHPLAQTDIIVTIDPKTGYVGMLSIPRDLQVYIAGYTQGDKLDKAFMYGTDGNTVGERVGSGANLAEQTIQDNFGIKIDYYVWVDIYGLAKVVDTVGGVDINAMHPMVDDIYPDDSSGKGNTYNYKRLYIEPGPQHMNGQQTLEYVRTRHADAGADFARSLRQQQLLSSLKQKLANTDAIAEAPQLLKDMIGSVFTDLTLDQIVQIGNYARSVDVNKIDRVTLDPPTYARASPLQDSTNYLPNCEAIKAKTAQMFGLGNQANCIEQSATSNAQSSTMVASIAQPANKANATFSSAALQPQQMVTQVVSNFALSTKYSEPAAVRSILNLLLIVVFQSFEALQS